MDQQISYEFLQLIRDDVKEGPYLRIYSHKQPSNPVQLPFNQVFNETVNELNIMNRLIASNTRLTNSFLQNGRQIHSKKQTYLNNFLKIYPLIAIVLESLPKEQRLIQIYSMMTISNLILKLSINMAKISVITVNKFPTPSFFNIFIVSIIFQKFLQFNLLLSKQKIAPFKQNDRLVHAKQFPKISIVKLSKIKNKYDAQYIRKCQHLFHDKAANIQFIELYEQDPCKDSEGKAFSRNQSINLSQKLGLKAPFGFELYLFVSEIIISKMNDFRPDIIIYMEDYSNDCVVIEPRIKGLIINEFSAKVQNKIFIFKQFGMTSNMKNEKMNEMNISILPQATLDSIHTSNESQLQPAIQQQIKSLCIQNTLIHRNVNSYLIDQNKKMYKQIQKNLITQEKIQISEFLNKVQHMKKILLDQLTYVSLAMIQKSGFDEVTADFRNYIFSAQFLQKFIAWIESQNKYYAQIDKGYSETCQLLNKTQQKIKGMLKLTNYAPKQQLYFSPQQVYGFPIFNLRTNKTENCIQFKDKKLRAITVQKQDQFYVAYQPEYIIIFVFKQSKYTVYTKHDSEMYFTAQIDEIYNLSTQFLSQKNSILIANQKYFYKAFGQYKDDTLNTTGSIYRICIQKPAQIQNCDWKSLGNTCLVYDKPKTSKAPLITGVQVPLQLKRYGYGYSYNTTDADTNKQGNIVIFGGGYNYKIQNQQKVNRFFYIIKDHGEKIVKIGKTNGELINQTENLRNKTIIYPFVYGIPLECGKDKQFAVLNTNGLLSNVNHYKKLFLSRIKMGPFVSTSDIGIIAQNKLSYNKETSEVSLANKNTIISHLLSNYNKINRLGSRIALYGQNNQIMVFKFQNKQADIDTFSLQSSSIDKNNIQVEFNNNKLATMLPDFKGMKSKS